MKKKAIYIVPDINKVSGGPRTRITSFKKVFREHNDFIIEGKEKIKLTFKSIFECEFYYVESASNRISIVDFFNLLLLFLLKKKIIVFIRDVYIEAFPNEYYKNYRNLLTLILNKFSNFFLSMVSYKMAFPTIDMGEFFFGKNMIYPKRKIIELPPGTSYTNKEDILITSKKKDTLDGVVYLGSISYKNSGFETFLRLSKKMKKSFKFYVLSNDKNIHKYKKDYQEIIFDEVPYDKIPSYFKKNNIKLSIHTRPRNSYDDMTFPIKILDFINFKTPFITLRHKPIENLLGKDYSLFLDKFEDDKLGSILQMLKNNDDLYNDLYYFLSDIKVNNSYEQRYNILTQSFVTD